MTQAVFDRVWKTYPQWLAGRRSLRSTLSPKMRATARRSGSRWALREVSFTLENGEGLGLIGANGAGKSTLLRLASGLSRPTRGAIAVSTDLASVLSLGSAFNGDLTGRENASTATVLAGIRVSRTRELVHKALEFAELEAFADAPVRSYSDGMKLRLAFGVVAQLDPSLLLLDEVIAVGDVRFQQKCMSRISELRSTGMSFLFASHDLDQIVEQCDRALWLDGGHVRAVGPAEEVVASYRDAMHTTTTERTPVPDDNLPDDTGLRLRENRFGSQEATIEDVVVAGTGRAAVVDESGSMSVTLRLKCAGRRVPNPIVGLSIHRAHDDVLCCQTSTDADGLVLPDLDGDLRVRFHWSSVPLVAGDYVLDVGLYESGWSFAYDYHWHAHQFQVAGSTDADESQAVFRAAGQQWSVERA